MKGDWRCQEKGCDAHGHEQTTKGAERALYHHFAECHNDPRF